MKTERHSPSSLQLFCASPALFVLERVLMQRQPVGAPAHRGTAVEAGVALGLMEGADTASCVAEALRSFDTVSALSGDPRKEGYRADIPNMVTLALDELRPYGKPTATQGFVEWRPEGLQSPIVGYYDFMWENHGIVVDLKTTHALPSAIKTTHARQVALYVAAISDNFSGRISYVTPKKRATYALENMREHRDALHKIALTVERFLALSDDPAFFAGIVAPDYESFYWTDAGARQAGFQRWGF